MSNRRRPSSVVIPTEDQVMTEMRRGAVVIDPDRCVLALFVEPDGHVRMKSKHSHADTAAMLRQLADKLAEGEL